MIELLRHAGTALEGAEAVVLGRSILVGRPLSALLVGENTTVTVCHSRTRDLAAVCSRADILVAAVGSPRLVGAEMVKPGATVIDVGTNRTEDGLVGDVDFNSVSEVAGSDHAGPRRGGADDDRNAACQHGRGGRCSSAVARTLAPTIHSPIRTRRDMEAGRLGRGEMIAAVSAAVALHHHVPAVVRPRR